MFGFWTSVVSVCIFGSGVLFTTNPRRVGTLAHQRGARSFPRQEGTVPVDSNLPLVPPRPQSIESRAVEAAETRLKDHLKQCRSDHQAQLQCQAEITEACRQASTQHVPQILLLSKTLQDLGPWTPLPASADWISRSFDIRDEPSKDDHSSMDCLRKGWHERHLGQRKVDPVKLKGVKLPRCLAEGHCHCARSAEGRLISTRQAAAKSAIQLLCSGKQGQLSLQHGDIILVWASDPTHSKSISHRVTYIACHYMKPWRPTLLELLIPTDAQEHFTTSFSGQTTHAQGDSQRDEHFTFKVARNSDGGPAFLSWLSFLGSLDSSCKWWVSRLHLSESLTPWPSARGLVRACHPRGSHSVLAFEAASQDVGGEDIWLAEEPEPELGPTTLEEKDEASDDEHGDATTETKEEADVTQLRT